MIRRRASVLTNLGAFPSALVKLYTSQRTPSASYKPFIYSYVRVSDVLFGFTECRIALQRGFWTNLSIFETVIFVRGSNLVISKLQFLPIFYTKVARHVLLRSPP